MKKRLAERFREVKDELSRKYAAYQANGQSREEAMEECLAAILSTLAREFKLTLVTKYHRQ